MAPAHRNASSEEKPTFIVDLWSRVFAVLRYFSILEILRNIVFPKLRNWKCKYVFTEAWALGHVVFALAVAVVASILGNLAIVRCLVYYGFLRVLNTVIDQLNVVIFDYFRRANEGRRHRVRSYVRLVVMLLLNYAEVILWFAAAYMVFEAHFSAEFVQGRLGRLIVSLSTSFGAMTSFSFVAYEAQTIWGALIILLQNVAGAVLSLIVIARFISLLPLPYTMDETEKPDWDGS